MTNRRQFLGKSLVASIGTYTVTRPSNVFAAPHFGAPLRQNDIKTFFETVKNGNLKKCREMVSAEKKLLDSTNADNQSAYTVALLHGKKEIAVFLAKSGYKPDLHECALALDWDRFNALANAMENKVVEAVNQTHPIGGSAMYCAAVGGAGMDMWRVYAQCGDPNKFETDGSSESPLHAALQFSDLKMAELTAATLLSNNTSPNPASNGKDSPLHIASKRGSVEIVELLINCGANVDAKNGQGKTALDLAKMSGNKSLIDLLENHQQIPRVWRSPDSMTNAEGQPYRMPNWDGLSLLKRREVVGSSHGNLAQVKSMVGKDKRLAHSVATTGERAVEAGAHMGNKPIVQFLLDNGAPYSLPTAVMMGDMTSVKKMLDGTPDRLHERGAHHFALLWYPIIGRCKVEMTALLLEKGADVEQNHFLGTTALHWAAMNDQVEVAERLIEAGANVNRIGRKFGGQPLTPLQHARSDKMKTLLKSKGAK